VKGIATAAACLALAALLPAGAAAAICDEGPPARDYARPLKRLPHMPAGPRDEHLPFAPARVFFNHSLGGPLFVGGGQVGYSLSFSPWTEGNAWSPLLNWTVEARYVRVDRRGRPLRLMGRAVHEVKRLRADEVGGQRSHALEFLFGAGRPGLYRLEITFEGAGGRRLGRYGEYLRVLRPVTDVRLRLDRATAAPGERIEAWLENYGTTSIFTGLYRSIQYFDGSSWVLAPGGAPGPTLAIGIGVGPGASLGCWGFTIPADEPEGLYRFVIEADAEWGTRLRARKPLDVSAEFAIVSPR
jgi:hypothetical protein